MIPRKHVSIIGGGPSAVYLLKHLLDHADFLKTHLGGVSIFEKGSLMGVGMPYSPEMTDKYNVANIPSEEMPPLLRSFADWLKSLDPVALEALNIEKDRISERKVYSRLALGEYFLNQYQRIVARLGEYDFEIREYPDCAVIDLQDDDQNDLVRIVSEKGTEYSSDKVIIATGHRWPQEDRPANGYYGSPWPIHKLLPEEGKFYNFSIGTLGASLSAFDATTSLAHRHGDFVRTADGFDYRPYEGTEEFNICMYAGHGRLPHLRYAIEETEHQIYQDVSREKLLGLADKHGFLRLGTYFDAVCRPVLRQAFRKDGLKEIEQLLDDDSFTLQKFVEKMSEEHSYPDAFEGMRGEMVEARDSVLGRKPIYWKDAIDSLVYTLNFHAELLTAEDQILLHSVLMPFVMNVIAAMPLHSADKLLALHDAGKLTIESGKVSLADEQLETDMTTIRVENDSKEKEVHYRMFIDCSGQKPVDVEDYPFASLVRNGVVRKARARFGDRTKATELTGDKSERVFIEDGEKFYHTGGIDIDENCRVIGSNGKPNKRIYDIASPHTTGIRPYSYGLESCSDTAEIIIRAFIEEFERLEMDQNDLNGRAEFAKNT